MYCSSLSLHGTERDMCTIGWRRQSKICHFESGRRLWLREEILQHAYEHFANHIMAIEDDIAPVNKSKKLGSWI